MVDSDTCTSCLKCTSVIGTVFLCILNTLFLLLGIGLLVVGILLKTNDDINDDRVMRLLDMVDFDDYTLKDILHILFIVVIVIGAFAILTAATGCLGACFKIRCFLVVYAIVVILCVCIEGAILYFWISVLNGVNETLQEQFEKLLMKFDGHFSTDGYSIGWTFVFLLFECCGVTPVSSGNNPFVTTEWWNSTGRGTDVIPSTCCNGVTKQNYDHYTNNNCTKLWTDYRTKGCYDVFDDVFSELAEVAIPVICVAIAIELTAVVFSFLLCCSEQKKQKVTIA